MMELEKRQEHLFLAIGGVGADLIDAAERRVFPVGLWRRWLPLAACMALLIGLSAWGLPLLRTKESVPAEPAETAAAPAEKADAAQQEMAALPFRWSDTQAEPKQRLVINGTIYYPEAVYEMEEADLGEWVAMVDGAAVYAAGDTKKQDKQGREMPLEVLVAQEAGYLYCLTYYAWDGPTFTLEELGARQDLSVLALEPAFDQAGHLTPQQLVQFFLDTLALEHQAGRRTVDLDRYLWYDEENTAYVIPVEDVAAQLDRYLEDWTWPELADHEALVLDDLASPERLLEQPPAATIEGDCLTLTTERLVYTIRWTENRMIYEKIVLNEP